MCFFRNKKIEVPNEVLKTEICHIVPQKQSKHLKINHKLVLQENCKCVFAGKKNVYEVFTNPATYELNGNSLPTLFHGEKFNKPNKKGVISTYFSCRIIYVPNNEKEIEVKIKKFKFKDYFFGKRKTNFIFSFCFEIENAKQFAQYLFKNKAKKSKEVTKLTTFLFEKELRKILSKHSFTLSDLIHFTQKYEDELTKIFATKLLNFGIAVKSCCIVDVKTEDDAQSEIINTNFVPSDIQKDIIDKKDFTVRIDGVVVQKNFTVSKRATANNLQKKYLAEQNGIKIESDNSEYTTTMLAGTDANGKAIEKGTQSTGKYCLKCGKYIDTKYTFCPYCGEVCS